jgi:hypothetical protein
MRRKLKCILVSHPQNAGKYHNIKIGSKSFERVEHFRYLGTTLKNQNFIREEIKSRLKSDSVCYHSVQNLLSSRLPSENINIKIYKTIILPVVLYGYETWSLTLWEEHRLRVFEKRVLRRIFGSKRDKVTGEWGGNCVMVFTICIFSRCCLGDKSTRMRWAGYVAHEDFGWKT